MKNTSKNLLTQKYLKSYLHYSPKTGTITRLSDSKVLSNVCGGGYRGLCILGKQYYAHRIAWLYAYGQFPVGEIDHINHDKMDNRLKNLRSCTQSENSRNQKKYKSNKSGYKGVSWSKKSSKWLAQITHNKKVTCLGRYDDKLEAAQAYDKKALELFGEFSCINSAI